MILLKGRNIYILCAHPSTICLALGKKNQVSSGVRKVSKHTSWPWGKTEARSQHISAMRHGRRDKNRVKNRMRFIQQQLKVSEGKEVSMTPDRLLLIWTSSMIKKQLGEQVLWHEFIVSNENSLVINSNRVSSLWLVVFLLNGDTCVFLSPCIREKRQKGNWIKN